MTWGPAEKIISGILDEHFRHHEAVLRGLEEPLAGLSLERKITDALRSAGLLDGFPCEDCGIAFQSFTFRFCRGCGRQA